MVALFYRKIKAMDCKLFEVIDKKRHCAIFEKRFLDCLYILELTVLN